MYERSEPKNSEGIGVVVGANEGRGVGLKVVGRNVGACEGVSVVGAKLGDFVVGYRVGWSVGRGVLAGSVHTWYVSHVLVLA
jgi:hypothetical protein